MQGAARLSALALFLTLTSCGSDPCDKSWLWDWNKADDLRKCAEKGHRGAQLVYGKLLAINGHPAESQIWLGRFTAGRGGKGAMEVARAFDGYRGGRQLAATWYRRAYELGEREAAVELGLMYHRDGNPTQANAWFERAVAGGDSYTAGKIGFLLSHKREEAAASAAWYKRGAQMGDQNSMSRYAQILQEGRGVPKDLREAFRWRFRAASHAKADGYDLLALARAYDQGLGTSRNPKAALTVLKAAKRKWIDDSDTETPRKMKEMEARLRTEA